VSERLLTAAELADQLGLSPATVVDWSEAGKLPGFRLGGSKGGRLRFRACEVEAVLESWRFGPHVDRSRSKPTPALDRSRADGDRSTSPSQAPLEGVES
jgi:excisionase family DNA binding protein